MNRVAMLAEEMGVPFVNMFEGNPVDFATDCYDAVGHLNPDGATKVTAVIGRWLMENCSLTDKRGEDAYAHWDDNLTLYEEFRLSSWGHMTLLD